MLLAEAESSLPRTNALSWSSLRLRKTDLVLPL